MSCECDYARDASQLVPAGRTIPEIAGTGLLDEIGLGKTWFPPVTV